MQRIVCAEHITNAVVKTLERDSHCAVCGSEARLVIDLSIPQRKEDEALRMKGKLA